MTGPIRVGNSWSATTSTRRTSGGVILAGASGAQPGAGAFSSGRGNDGAAGSDQGGYEVVIWDKSGEVTRFSFRTKAGAETFADQYRKGAYSLQDGNITKVEVKRVAANGSPDPKKTGASSPGKGTSPSASADDNRDLWKAKLVEYNREHIKSVVRDYLASQGREMKVTSEYRKNSAAHMRGAIDLSSKDLTTGQRHADAKEISRQLGKGYTVVVEEVTADRTQTNTSYRDGKLLNIHKDQLQTASNTHTHIQPDKHPDD
jgi:hypothetical protein